MAEQQPEQQSPIRVLLVDDDPTFSKLVIHKLERYKGRSFAVAWKTAAQPALDELAVNKNYDIILSDYSMPEMTGIEFCLQLNETGNQIPIIFITASRDLKLAVEAMKLGVEDYIVKEETTGSVVPLTIAAVHESVRLRRQKASIEKAAMLSQQRAQAVKELVVTVSHEFNNPLAAIKISMDLLQRLELKPEHNTLLRDFEYQFEIVQQAIRELRELQVD